MEIFMVLVSIQIVQILAVLILSNLLKKVNLTMDYLFSAMNDIHDVKRFLIPADKKAVEIVELKTLNHGGV
jgi:hypothetical protein